MQPSSYKLLKGASLVVFFVSIMLFSTSLVVDVASRRVQVRDKAGQIIGEAWIPHDYGTDFFLSSSLMILSGVQLWTIVSVGRAAYDKHK